MSVDEVIGEVAQKHILPLNMAAGLAKAGAAKGYVPASDEFDTIVAGVTYRAQAFRNPTNLAMQEIAYCIVGDWGAVHWTERAN